MILHSKRESSEQVACRFWDHVCPEPNTGCWLWTGCSFHYGHGAFSVAGKNLKAHRVSWFICTGNDPLDLCVCHKCDTPACVNPDHLFLGTQRDNTHDMFAKGRANIPYGDHHPNAKLTSDRVVEIRRRLAAGETHEKISASFNVTKGLISQIHRRKIWNHVE